MADPLFEETYAVEGARSGTVAIGVWAEPSNTDEESPLRRCEVDLHITSGALGAVLAGLNKRQVMELAAIVQEIGRLMEDFDG